MAVIDSDSDTLTLQTFRDHLFMTRGGFQAHSEITEHKVTMILQKQEWRAIAEWMIQSGVLDDD